MLISSAFSVEWVGGRAEVFVFVFVIVFRLVFTTHLVFAFSVEWVGELKFLSLTFTKYLVVSLLSRMGGWAQVADMELRLWARLWLSLLRWNLKRNQILICRIISVWNRMFEFNGNVLVLFLHPPSWLFCETRAWKSWCCSPPWRENV